MRNVLGSNVKSRFRCALNQMPSSLFPLPILKYFERDSLTGVFSGAVISSNKIILTGAP